MEGVESKRFLVWWIGLEFLRFGRVNPCAKEAPESNVHRITRGRDFARILRVGSCGGGCEKEIVKILDGGL